MKKVLSMFIAILIFTGITFSQQEPGTVPVGWTSQDGLLANGLTEYYSVTGKYILSADGAGIYPSPTYTVDVNKPNAGATVHKAFFLLAPLWNYSTSNITLAGTSITTWDHSVINTSGGTNYITDVTSIVAPIINPAAPGVTSLTVVESDSHKQDGVALLVIFSDPSADEKTIIIMFGGLSTSGDNFSITLAVPIDPIAAGALLNMGLGISYGYQGSWQYTIVDVNGQRLTTSAGGQDDGCNANGCLITVGGYNDSNANPPNPFALPPGNPFYDDELYSLLPLITSTTTNILVATSNPSNDDNVFLSYFEISGAAIIGEGILLTQTNNVETVNTSHTVKALVQDNTGAPVVGKQVDFTVLSGPNAGNMFSGNTDSNGEVLYTYTGTGGVGFDDIQGCFIDSQGNTKCSNILTVEWIGGPLVPLADWAIYLGIFLIAAFMVFRFRRRLA